MTTIITTTEALTGIVEELLVGVRDGKDRRPALVETLRDLMPLSQALVRDPDAPTAPPGRRHSPAPWSASPAELLDEIGRGAVDLVATARRVLGLPPATVHAVVEGQRREVPLSAVAQDVAGAAALRMLPDLHRRIRADRRLVDHWLVRVELEDGTLDAGAIEKRLRSWRHRARVLAGYDVRPLPVGQVPNPWHLGNIDDPNDPTTPWWRGPVCPTTKAGLCGHSSCSTLRWARTERWVMAECPWCSRSSLLQDPADGAVYCARPSCRDDAGHRPRWSVAELGRLGVLVASEVTA